MRRLLDPRWWKSPDEENLRLAYSLRYHGLAPDQERKPAAFAAGSREV